MPSDILLLCDLCTDREVFAIGHRHSRVTSVGLRQVQPGQCGGLVWARSGSVRIRAAEIVGAGRTALRAMPAQVQMVFPDPMTSLNPRMRIGDAVGEPLRVRGLARGAELRARVASMLAEVGLQAEQLGGCHISFRAGSGSGW